MADNDAPDFKILAELPERLKHLADKTGQASSSSAQASAAQLKPSKTKPSKTEPDQAQSSKGAVARVASNISNTRLGLVEEGEQTVPSDLTESEMSDEYEGEHPDSSNGSQLPEYDDSMSNHDTDTESGTPSTSREGRIQPSMSELMELATGLVLKMAAFNEPPAERGTSQPLDHTLAQIASIRSYEKPGASSLHNEIHGPSADDNQQALQSDDTENVTDTTSPEFFKGGERGALPLQAGSKEAPASSSSATPLLEDAMKEAHNSTGLVARVDKFIDRCKQEYRSQSPLFQIRKETVLLYLYRRGVSPDFYSSFSNAVMMDAFAFAGDDGACDMKRRAENHTNLLRQAPHFHERAIDKSAIPWFVKSDHPAEFEEPAASAHLRTKSKAHKKGGIKEKTTQKGYEGIEFIYPHQRKDFVTDEDFLIPPVILWIGVPILSIPASSSGPSQLVELKFREDNIGLSAVEVAKVPVEFRYLHEDTLTVFWDFAYNSGVRKTVFDYKRGLALAGEADKVLDLPNRLLAALVDIQEAEIREGAEHIVVANDIKTSGHEIRLSTITKELANLLNTDIPTAALLEFENSRADPSYNTTTAREKFALSQGVKLDSVEVYELFRQYQELLTSHYPSKLTTTRSDAKMAMLERLVSMQQKAYDSDEEKENELTVEGATTSEVKDKEGDSLVEDSAIAKVQSKAKGKGKKSGKGKKKKSKLPMDDATTGEGKSKESDMLVEGSAVDEGKGKGDEFTLEDATTGKGKAKESNVFVKDQANGKGKGKENGLPVEDNTSGKGKESDQSNSDASRKFKLLDSNTAPKSAPSSALPIGRGGQRELFEDLFKIFQAEFKPTKAEYRAARLTPTKEEYVAARMHLYSFMGSTIRPQKASPEQLELMCSILSAKVVFDSMSRYIEELKWNRYVELIDLRSWECIG